jgi:Rrf2 family protein
MKFSAQEEYGLRCLLRIGKAGLAGSVTIAEISRAEGLTATHVAKLLMILRREGYITSTRGQSGGYTLSRAPETIAVGEVLAVLGGKLYDQEFCARHGSLCLQSEDCTIRSLWQVIQHSVDRVLDRLTLGDLLAGRTSTTIELMPIPARLTTSKN